jgi:hypothetical protein
MQLVAEVSIPKKIEDAKLTLNARQLKKLRKQGLSLEWFVLFALRMSYAHKDPSIDVESFCEQWGIMEHELEGAIAKLQKKGELHRPTKTIQLELFPDSEE